jgi:hypothetical protein
LSTIWHTSACPFEERSSSLISEHSDNTGNTMSLVGMSSWLESQVVGIVNQSSWLSGEINEHAISSAVNVCRHRPHPWSTYSDYVSWVTLTDQRYSARHLPAYYPNYPLPDATQLTQFFARPAGTQELCPKSTVLFPAFAQYLTDGFIRTRMPHTGDRKNFANKTRRITRSIFHRYTVARCIRPICFV